MEEPLQIPGVSVSRTNSMKMLRQIVQMTGTDSALVIFSYSVTDGWLRQLLHLRQEFHVKHITLVLDREVMIRHREKLLQIQNVADQCYLTDSHAKVYLSQGTSKTIALITSANATNNYRNECFYVTDRTADIEHITRDIRTILSKADRITG